MDNLMSILCGVFERCEVCFNGNAFSKEHIIRSYQDFLASTFETDGHNVDIVLHTGSECFEAMTIAVIAIVNILQNKVDPVEVMRSIKPGERLNYDNKLRILGGFVDDCTQKVVREQLGSENYAVLLDDKGNRIYCPRKRWKEIIPYHGKAKTTRTLTSNNAESRRLFMSKVLGMEEQEVTRKINVSTVFIISRALADRLIRNISFRYVGGEIKLTELVPVSYFVENNQEYPYSGNSSRIEPVIKITGRVSVARFLLLNKQQNENGGLVTFGEDVLSKGQTELPELIERRSIHNVILCTHIDSPNGSMLISNYENAKVFACTRELLLSTVTGEVLFNPTTNKLMNQVDSIIDRQIDVEVLDDFDWEQNKNFKRALKALRFSEFDSDKKDRFIIQSHAMMNLFWTAVFPIDRLEKEILLRRIRNVESVNGRIKELEDIALSFPDYLIPSAVEVIETLKNAYSLTADGTLKQQRLEQIIEENRGCKIAIIVPKAYYATVLQPQYCRDRNVKIMTANDFDNSLLFDLIICVGNFVGTRFDAFRCMSSSRIIILLYECEKYLYRKRERASREIERMLNTRMNYEMEEEEAANDIEEVSSVEEINDIDIELQSYVGSSFIKAARAMSGGNKTGLSEIVATAVLDSGESCFFTKNYKAYVMDSIGQSVREVKVEDISEGDTIIFTRSNAKTRDIVDNILVELIDSGKISGEMKAAYRLSKKWREELLNYMVSHELNASLVAKRMIENGVSVQEATIRRWLDEDSHTVGPRELSSIQQVALLVYDNEMFDHADQYFDACAKVRNYRRRILDAIGEATLTQVSGKRLKEDSILATVSEQIKEQAVVLRIEYIAMIDDKVPTYLVNRPVYV